MRMASSTTLARLVVACAWVLVGCSSTVAGVAMPPATGTAPSTVSVAKLSDLLLPPDQVANTMGIVVLVVNPSMQGMLEPPRGESTEKDCMALLAPAQGSVYAGTGSTGVATRGLISPDNGGNSHLVIESVIAFAGPAAAGKVLTVQTAHWSACSGQTITVIVAAPAGAPPLRVEVGPLIRSNDTVALTEVIENSSGLGCQRALAARSNVIIDVAACRDDTTNQAVDLLQAIAGKIPP
jgi:hypothetical protein